MRQFTIICNWKMYFSYEQACQWIEQHKQLCTTIAQQSKLIICPSFDALAPVTQHIKNTPIALGAQDCSAYISGAYTGQVQATSLKQLGCTYVIIGHSEIRSGYHQTNTDIANKLQQALDAQLIPIIAIGQQSKQDPLEALKQQLEPFWPLLQASSFDHWYLAYEPVWAIGSGQIPANHEIAEVFLFLKQLVQKNAIQASVKLLYGGSVNAKNIATLKNIPLLNGFLIGAASTDIKQLNEIASYIVAP